MTEKSPEELKREFAEDNGFATWNETTKQMKVSKIFMAKLNALLDKLMKETAREAWFEGMKQGIKFDREDREARSIVTKRVIKEPRVSFDEWFRSRMKGESK